MCCQTFLAKRSRGLHSDWSLCISCFHTVRFFFSTVLLVCWCFPLDFLWPHFALWHICTVCADRWERSICFTSYHLCSFSHFIEKQRSHHRYSLDSTAGECARILSGFGYTLFSCTLPEHTCSSAFLALAGFCSHILSHSTYISFFSKSK